MTEEIRTIDKKEYSQRDIYFTVSKVIAALIPLAFIYAEFVNMKATIGRLESKVNILEEMVDENNVKMYRHVADKEGNFNERMDRIKERIEKDIEKLESKTITHLERISKLESRNP